MTARDISAAITPGSMAYGDRQQFESNLPQALSQQAAQAGAAGEPGDETLAIPEDPIGALLAGEVAGDPNSPVTAGLSVGPGPGPQAQNDIMQGTRADRFRALATEASSPLVRMAARNELRRMAREGI